MKGSKASLQVAINWHPPWDPDRCCNSSRNFEKQCDSSIEQETDCSSSCYVFSRSEKSPVKLHLEAMEKLAKMGSSPLKSLVEWKPSLKWLKACSLTVVTSQYMVTDNEKMVADLENPYILITDKKISNIQEILPLLESILQSNRPLLIIADDVMANSSTLVLNKIRGTFNVVAVKAPGLVIAAKAMLEDIAILTGGTVITEDLGLELKDATIEALGQAAKVSVDKDSTVIVEGSGNQKRSLTVLRSSSHKSKPQPLNLTVKITRTFG